MERSPLLAAGALNGAIAVATGAMAAHGLKDRLEPKALAVFETAARYQMYLPTEEELRAELEREREAAERVLRLSASMEGPADGAG